jgi:Helix-loop-helix DNA-binding domain
MRVLSSAFYRLKTIIPWVPHDTKLSKLDTLRLARNYIAYLTATLDGQPVNEITNKMPHPQKMVSRVFPLFSSNVERRGGKTRVYF